MLEKPEPSDRELVRAAKGGETAAFEELVRRHSPALFSFIYRLVGSPTDAEELTQETWVRAWRALAGFKEKSGFKTWVFRIGMNLALNLRARARHTEELNESLPALENVQPEEVFRKKRRAELVQEALARLPGDQRVAVVLWAYQGMSYQEIAATMGRSVRAVDSLLFRAKAGLREFLEEAKRRGEV